MAATARGAEGRLILVVAEAGATAASVAAAAKVAATTNLMMLGWLDTLGLGITFLLLALMIHLQVCVNNCSKAVAAC